MVSSVRAYIRQCQRIWQQVRTACLHYSTQTRKRVNRTRRGAPKYEVGQRGWLATRDLPFQVDSRKLAPRYVGPCEIVQVVNPVLVRL